MTALDRLHPVNAVEELRVPQSVAYNWEYDATRRQLMRLYENAKRDQWNATTRLDWTVDVDPSRGLVPDVGIGIYGTPLWEKLSAKEIEKLRHEAITWQLCQFLHGEQGALLATAQIVDSVPWYEAKQYGATQVMDEARHVEVYRKFVQEKLEHEYPVNAELKKLLDLILTDSRWDMKFLGMQIIVEGLALAAFGTIRDTATNPLLRDRITNREVWEAMGLDPEECIAHSDQSDLAKQFRYRLFSKIVPNVKSLGLLSPKQRERFEALGILEFEGNTTSDVDQEMEEERRIRAGEATPAAA